MNTIAVNGRFRCHAATRLTGVQRYATEICARLAGSVEIFTPKHMQFGAQGHMWEQFVLPGLMGRRLLWSPSGTGPVLVSNQVPTIHDTGPWDHPEWFSKAYANWTEYSTKLLSRRSAHIITVSSFSKERILSTLSVDEDKVSVVAEGVDSQYRPRSMEEIQVIRQRLGIPPDSQYALCVGTLQPRKNVHTLLKAWQIALPALPDEVMLVLAGAQDIERVFARTALGSVPQRVLSTGYVPDELLPALYAGATLFVYPSLYEGFGLPVLEAMACGTPVVTSATASLPEVAGGAARLVDPHDAEELADAIVSVVLKNELAEQLRRAGRERSAQFTWDRAASETFELLQNFA